MKRVLRFLVYLYPAWWRRRYGLELEALLEDSGSRWRDVWDLFRGAMQMQMSKWTFGAIVLACGAAGLALAGVLAFAMPYQYQSTAILKMEPVNTDALDRVVHAAFTPQALSDIIRREHLYGEAPIDGSIDRFRRAISIRAAGSNLAQVSFAYENPVQTQRVTQDLMARIISANVSPNINPNGLRLEFTVPPDAPKKVGEGKRHSLAHLGFPAGMLFGVVLALILRRRSARTSK